MQDVVATNVIEGLELRFSSEERLRMVKDAPEDPLAYEYYLRSLNYPSSIEGNEFAVEMLNKSIELDSNFAPVYVQLGRRLQDIARFAFIENQSLIIEESIIAFERAVELNHDQMDALGNLAILKTEIDQKDDAVELTRRVLH